MAGIYYKLKVFQGILKLDKDHLTSEEVNILFLATHNSGRTLFHMTSFCELDLFQEILFRAKRFLTIEEVK